MKTGTFITFEGIEGCGKTTQLAMVADFLQSRGIEVVRTREPGGTALADAVRGIFHDIRFSGMGGLSELFLVEAARADHVERVVLPALEAGKVVLCDRFTDATLAYQGYGRGQPLDFIRSLNNAASRGISPGLTVLLDVGVDVGLKRARERNALASGSSEERMEAESFEFHERVRRGYLDIAFSEPYRVKIVDGSGSVEEVFERVKAEIVRYLSLGDG